jgi:hypothetical protein
MVKAIRMGFVVHIHSRVSGVGWIADVAAMPWNGICSTLYVCVRAIHPPSTANHLFGAVVQRALEPVDTLKQGDHPAPVIAVAAWRDRAPERHKNTSEAPCRTPSGSRALQGEGEVGIDRHRRIALPFQEQWRLTERLNVRRPT